MRLTSPASTLPGPHSTTCVTPARAQAPHRLDPAHRAERLAYQRVADRVGVGRCGDVDVVDHRDARRAAASRPPAAAAARSAAGFISDEWNGADTGSGSARLAPAGLQPLAGALDRRLVAGDHGLPGALKLTASHDLALRRLRRRRRAPRRRRGRGPRPWRPSPTGTASCIACARNRTSGSASRSVSAPAATSAVYSPRRGRPPPPARRRPRHARRDSRRSPRSASPAAC